MDCLDRRSKCVRVVLEGLYWASLLKSSSLNSIAVTRSSYESIMLVNAISKASIEYSIFYYFLKTFSVLVIKNLHFQN